MFQRILIRGVNWLGDAVMTTPALQRIRERFPGSRITLLTPAKLADLWDGQHFIDQTIALKPGQSLWNTARRIRSEDFDLAIILPNSPRSALEAWLARIPTRVGYARPWRSWCLSRAVPPYAHEVRMHKRTNAEIQTRIQAADTPRQGPRSSRDPGTLGIPETAHHLYHYLNLAAALNADPTPLAPRLDVAQEQVQSVRDRFQLHADAATLWLGLNPGAEYGPAKRWPRERFIETAIAVQKHSPIRIRWMLFGGPSDVSTNAEIEAAIQSAIPKGRDDRSPVNLADRTSLLDLCAAMSLCPLILTNDTGPMHVAAAVGATVVVPFGSTSPTLTCPGLPTDTRHLFMSANAPCAPCFRRNCPIDLRCLTGISSEQVTAAILDRITESGTGVHGSRRQPPA